MRDLRQLVHPQGVHPRGAVTRRELPPNRPCARRSLVLPPQDTAEHRATDGGSLGLAETVTRLQELLRRGPVLRNLLPDSFPDSFAAAPRRLLMCACTTFSSADTSLSVKRGKWRPLFAGDSRPLFCTQSVTTRFACLSGSATIESISCLIFRNPAMNSSSCRNSTLTVCSTQP